MTHKVTKEQYQTAYKTSVDQSLKNMPNVGMKNKITSKSQQQQQQQQSSSTVQTQTTKVIATDMAINETVIYICPLKCGFQSENFEILKVHCNAEHPNQINDGSSSSSSITTDLQQQQPQPTITHPNNNPSHQNIHHIVTNQETSTNSSNFLNSSHQTNQSNMTTISIKQELPSDTSIYQLSATIPPSQPTSTIINQSTSLLEPIKVQDKFTCPVTNCGFVSTKETEFKMHCVDHTVANDENIRYRCTANECKESYNNVESFIKHLQSHDKANQCNNNTETEVQSGSNESIRAKSRYLILIFQFKNL